ncbi:MAG: TusE/DsrC/DsvC family sulfur relay protein [Pseudomonadales bacterium]|nr:TusE/DsrC/DsvC family sulfur relay protein [Pseudomonadales bacterium]
MDPTDKKGCLKNLDDWSETVAEAIAQQKQITLTEQHWEIIRLMQNFYQQFEISPAMRVLVKIVDQQLVKEKGCSIYLMNLSPESPAKLASKIAGLPKPTNYL